MSLSHLGCDFVTSPLVEKHPHINQLPWKPSKSYIISFNIFLPFRDTPIGMSNLKLVECTVLEIIRRGLSRPFVEGVDTKYLHTGRVKIRPLITEIHVLSMYSFYF